MGSACGCESSARIAPVEVVSRKACYHTDALSKVIPNLAQPGVVRKFESFVVQARAEENLKFFCAVQSYKLAPSFQEGQRLYNLYIDQTSDQCINVNHAARQALLKVFDSNIEHLVNGSEFDLASTCVVDLLEHHLWNSFQKSNRNV
jgi:hypothetical protein